ncbi:MAG: cytochrome c [Deltaproteobacteria bacterium]|nr:cytochrome c [Deltaproteobacteria bacterium]
MACVALVALGCTRFDRRSDDDPAGAAVFGVYCASCHGVEGRGDGPVAEALHQRPADLTRIASSEGWFPNSLILMIIDGRYASHGGREMPVLGAQLSREELRAVTDFLEQIQE